MQVGVGVGVVGGKLQLGCIGYLLRVRSLVRGVMRGVMSGVMQPDSST